MYKLIITLFASAAITSSCQQSDRKSNKSKPNIIYILADDLGDGELGCYGQKLIETPNIDKLAENGIMFTQHYSGSPVCAPSRCVLMTGKHTGHAYIRGNDEWGERGPTWDYLEMFRDSTLEGQRPIPEGTTTIGRLLQQTGYKTGIIGKWGLGAPHTAGIPNKQGFDFFYGYNCQRQAHTFYPLHLYKNENRVYLNNDTVKPGTKLERGADPYDLKSYDKFTLNDYSADLMFDELINFVEENREEPFVMYWANPIPHVPLQAPQKWVDYYVKKFGDEDPYTGRQGYFPHRYPHAAYAAMVSYMDEQVGLLIEKLKELGLYENTLIMFTSDNGPSYAGGTDSPWFNSGGIFDSERGRGKGYLYEGGIRVPMIASWPGHIEPGTTSNHISAFWDVLPTLCEISGVQPPEDTDGISFLPAMLGKGNQKSHDFMYWEFPQYNGQQAVRMGKWKGVRMNISKGNTRTELYNLEKDIKELNDVSKKHPDVVRKIEKIMEQEHVPAEIERFRLKELGD
jgi:arylsulfatase